MDDIVLDIHNGDISVDDILRRGEERNQQSSRPAAEENHDEDVDNG